MGVFCAPDIAQEHVASAWKTHLGYAESGLNSQLGIKEHCKRMKKR